MKAIFDCLVSALALILLAPVFFVVAIIIFVDDPGSPFFKQKRVGLEGREFGMYKFRSMKCNASEVGPYFTQKNDPRITRVGRVIRRTSIDELPQLINVLLGDMSIVGPRPDVPVQEKNYTPDEWHLRNSVKPGITGLAQATVRSNTTPEERTRLDLEYVNNHNFYLDLKIIAMTVKQVISKGGN
ncbi:sugar transferase [Vibrio vulnificus]|nr:sugar transferase [Vibrio vulnificus]EIV8468229.1 sugar transferase [Vibrio vulnificus]EKK9986979.1 sugar transferase [Vibrio vulnificus]